MRPALAVLWGMLIIGPASMGPVLRAQTCGPAEAWMTTTTVGAPSPRRAHTAVWTGTEMIVWGGLDASNAPLGTGGRYDPQTDHWLPVSTVDAPQPRAGHAAVWTGTHMLVWGGAGATYLGDGGLYDPVTDSWTPVSTLNAPSPRAGFAYAWTGTELLVVAGSGVDENGCQGASLQGGGLYNPSTEQWYSISGGPFASDLGHAGVWTGGRFFVSAGGLRWDYSGPSCFTTGPEGYGEAWLFDPAVLQWVWSTSNGPQVITPWTLWSGQEVLVLGSNAFTTPFPTRFDPLSTSFAAMAPHASGDHGSVVWAGDRAMLWRAPNVSGTWDPGTDSWSPVTPRNAPSGRRGHTLIWTGAEVVVWGGTDSATGNVVQTGGRHRTGEPDADGDLEPDACDACPFDPDNDADGDTLCANVDNCPDTPNPAQADQDNDGVGDPCDACPGDPVNDVDHDGRCGNVDNCPLASNPLQKDTDLDGVGNVCDLCPLAADAGQLDTDLDGSGDACDCDDADPQDRPPPDVPVRVGQLHEPLLLIWNAVPGADRYSVLRGDLEDLPLGNPAQCVASGLDQTSASLPGVPAPGQGYYFLVQAESFDCGLGSLGFQSGEVPRPDLGACAPTSVLRIDPASEQTIYGSTNGGLAGVQASDNGYEELAEETTSGPPSQRISRLEHRWTFDVVPGTAMELHIEGFRTDTGEGEYFDLWRSIDGLNWDYMARLPDDLTDPNGDAAIWLSPALAGQVIVMIRDTDREPGRSQRDRFFVDELFIRVVEPQ